MSRINFLSTFFAVLTMATVFLAGCGEMDGSITPPGEGEFPTLSLVKITDSDGKPKYRVESNKPVSADLPVLIEEGTDEKFVVIPEGEEATDYFVLRAQVTIVDAEMRQLQKLPAVSKGGWNLDDDVNFKNTVYDIDPDADRVAP